MVLKAGQAALGREIMRGLKGQGRRSKYNAVRTTVDGFTFDSKKEAKRYGELKWLEADGQIRNLKRQPSFVLLAPVVVGGRENVNDGVLSGMEPVGTYRADFSYEECQSLLRPPPRWLLVVEDVKSAGTRTPVYRLKKKLVEATYGIVVKEV